MSHTKHADTAEKGEPLGAQNMALYRQKYSLDEQKAAPECSSKIMAFALISPEKI